MRAVIYARYSSDLQDARSIADQVALAHERAQREGWEVVHVYSDAAISGSSLVNRPGLLDLLAGAKAGAFDIVVTESIDRLSRDQENIAGLHKRLSFHGIKIVTLADGEVGKLHIGLKGLIASLYLDDLAQKTRRGQIGRLNAGRIPGGRCYGYDVVAGDAGLRRIDEQEAAVVRRIFTDYAAGMSPLHIAGQLNREGARGPRGGTWSGSTINGSRKRANGILSNELYAGRLVYNRQRFVKDPETGKRQAKPNARAEWLVHDLPDLRIIDAQLWETVQAKRQQYSSKTIVNARRPKRPLSGLLKCGFCGGSYIVTTKDWLGCSARRNKGTCDNRRMVTMTEVEERVLSALEQYLLEPEAVQRAVESYRAERDRLAKGRARDRNALEREAAELDRKMSRIVAAIEGGDGDARKLAARLSELEGQHDAVTQRLAAADTSSIVALHPQAANRYRHKVTRIREALAAGDEAGREAINIVRELIGRIVVTPRAGREPLSLEIVGDLAKLLQPREQVAVTASVVAGTGFEPVTFRL